MQPIWHHYFGEAAAVLYVVDAAQPAALADAALTLFDLLQHPHLQVKTYSDGDLHAFVAVPLPPACHHHSMHGAHQSHWIEFSSAVADALVLPPDMYSAS